MTELRKSTAKWMPFSSRPGASISLGLEAPQQSSTRSYSFRSSAALHTPVPTSAFVTKLTPSSSIRRILAVNHLLFQLHIRYAVAQQPADPVSSFKYCYRMAHVYSASWAAARPDGPLPTTATLLAGPDLRRLRPDQPCLPGIFNDSPLIFLRGHRISVQIAGTGRLAERRANPGGELREAIGLGQPHDTPVSSCPDIPDRSIPGTDYSAGIRWPCRRSSCPAWQKGTPQAIQRAPCSLCFSCGRGVWNSWKFLIRSRGGVHPLSWRS